MQSTSTARAVGSFPLARAGARRAVAAITVALLLPVAALAQNIAIVNGKPVPKARVEALMSQATKQGQPPSPELEAQVRDEVVMREMFMQEAEKRGLANSVDYKQQMELARQSILIRDLFSQWQQANPVTDAEVQAEYDKFKAQSGGGSEYRASHILVEKEDDAKAIIAKLKAGGNFAELAKANSKDPGSAEKGGDLDWANPSSYVPEFSQALASLKKGETTPTPVKSQFGYHIIRLVDVRQAEFPPLEQVKAQIQQRLAQQKMVAFRDEIRSRTKTDYKFAN